ncbi:hypothetical protein CAPN002_11620 [Capnocytophaga stomatis]|uniref:Tetratricopeptide repeat protein n=1 Tax=Capnocytophaga stomatis TaxID=1848904 RepID=A0A250FYG2_9FLAO|nr:hypothetical protein [Capnocytophaga stomatis]ATA89118.1 hypothetical protein CGC58_04940 [Capnocytophaga stomatis]GIJ93944.1 hypothetical protein CAPN002_11620 [Capnocytophaga stomatis]GIM48665.1 hypothetical protein CAPN003_01170 [Capnocytophaga stomatis]
MTVKEFVEILKNPYVIGEEQAHELDHIVKEYPYFQAARVLQLKVLHSEGNYRYNKALKLAAVHVLDRSVLYEFIHSKAVVPDVSALKQDLNEIKKAVQRQETKEIPEVVSVNYQPSETFTIPQVPKSIFDEDIFSEKFIRQGDIESILVHKEEMTDLIPEKTGGKQDAVLGNKVDSISEWLKNISEDKEMQSSEYKDDNVAKKFHLIDKFLETNPKIEPTKDYSSNVNLANEVKTDPRQLMTETLAQVYVNQKKYKQAIQAYEILILKNPEKSAYFASQIQEIKNLQQQK